MYYLVNGYRFITQKIDTEILTVTLENYAKSASKDFIKTYPAYFFMNFFATFLKQTLSEH